MTDEEFMAQRRADTAFMAERRARQPEAEPVAEPWQPMEQTGSMSDFSTGTGTPNPEKWAARIPVDVGLGMLTGGGLGALSTSADGIRG